MAPAPQRKKHFRSVSLIWLLPNMLTVAGLVARRILLESAVGDELAIGQQLGIIRFGSRVDLWLPADTPVLVLAGQRTVAGETVLADLSGTISEPMTARQQ